MIHSRGTLVVIESDDPDSIHRVGRWERVNCAEAELAFVVEDAHQGQGLGRKLLEATIGRAHEEGFTRLVATCSGRTTACITSVASAASRSQSYEEGGARGRQHPAGAR
jgi:GNAT superfamily N-acetyltransferase